MNCAVCGKEFGLWARLTGDSDDAVCKACEYEGVQMLQSLLGLISPSANLAGLVRQFDETTKKFRIPEVKLAPMELQMITSYLSALADKEEITGDDLDFFNSFWDARPGRSVVAGTPVANAAGKIMARLAIERWRAGKPPEQICTGLLLEDGETCRWQEPARLLEQRTRREYVGGYGGVSVRVARGVRIHSGAFKGVPIDTTYLADRGFGFLHFTSERLAFTGDQQSVAFPLQKIISVSGFEDGFQVFRIGAKRPTILQVPHPELTLQLLALATPSQND